MLVLVAVAYIQFPYEGRFNYIGTYYVYRSIVNDVSERAFDEKMNLGCGGSVNQVHLDLKIKCY